jgi:hypothetical protein
MTCSPRNFGRLKNVRVAASLAMLAALLACGKKRPFADLALTDPNGDSSVEEDAGARPLGFDPVGTPTGGEPLPTAPNFVPSSESIDGLQSSDECSGDDAGSCSPLPLVDGGSASTCPGCVIDGACVAADALAMGNACLICDPSRDPLRWSPNGAECDDGLFCTVDDACSAGQCIGAGRECDDGVACNGVSACDETLRACSPDTNECDANFACEIASDTCVSTCNGCLINGVCVSVGAEAAGNPCRVCDPTVSSTSFSAVPGKSCGSGPSACSAQDSCNALGQCQPNHLPANTPCGNAASTACNQADSCDANGNCLQRVANNGSVCDDGVFCTVGDRCQGGECLPTGNRNCGASSTCDEGSNQCQCQGCSVNGTCFAAGNTNPGNVCQICDPGRSRTNFSANQNASCGDGQTCNAQGQCIALPRQPLGTRCTTASECSSGFCRLWFQDLDDDAHGDPTQSTMLCSPSPADDELASQASGRLLPILDDAAGRHYAGVGDDCCDSLNARADSVFPGNTNFVSIPQTACSNVDPFDYDCSGQVEDQYLVNTRTGSCGANCVGALWVVQPPCGELGDIRECRIVNGSCTTNTLSTALRVCM